MKLPAITIRVDGMLASLRPGDRSRYFAIDTTFAFDALINAAEKRGIDIQDSDFEVTITAGLRRRTGPKCYIITEIEREP